ncbi:MAG: leucine-rich repeat protein [Lachnospiraceae bacterium]
MLRDKNNLKTKILLLFVVLIVTMTPVSVFATESTDSIVSGTCGESAVYTYDESTNILTISGSGAISDSAFSCYEADDPVRKKISSKVKTVIINEGITEIGMGTFDCCRCTSIKLPNSLKIIRRSAFYCCYITSIDIPDTVTTIEGGAFNGCQELVKVKLPANIDIINEGIFSGCKMLEKIDIPLSVKKIGKNAFFGCCSSSFELNISCNVELEFNSEGILGPMGYANSFCGIINVVPDSNQEGYFLNNYASEISAGKITLNTTLTHSFSNRVEKEVGTYIETCSLCGEEKTVKCHNLVKFEGKDATCLENGTKEYWYCDICNRYFADDKAKTEIVEDIETWKVIHADGHKYYWYHTDLMGNNAYDLLCSECTENSGRGYLNSDNRYYIYGYVENGEYYHYIYDENAKCLGSEKCNVDCWSSDENFYEGVCKCHRILNSVKVALYGYDDVKVSWSKISRATGYKVYYKKSTSNTWSSKTTTGTSVKIANLSDGVKYDIKVGTYRTKDGYKCYNKDKSISIYTLKKVTGVKITKSRTKVKVSWKNIAGETGYQISQSTKKKRTNIIVTYKTTFGNSKSISATKGRTYYYKVRAYKVVDGKKIYGPWSTAMKYVRK